MAKKHFWAMAIICFFITVAFTPSEPALAEEKPMIFGLLLVGPYNDHGWSQAHFDGGKYVEEKLPGTKMIYIDKVNPADRQGVTIPQLVDDMVEKGAKLIIANSDDIAAVEDLIAAMLGMPSDIGSTIIANAEFIGTLQEQMALWAGPDIDIGSTIGVVSWKISNTAPLTSAGWVIGAICPAPAITARSARGSRAASPCAAPSIRPGISASTKERSMSAVTNPRLGNLVVKG